MVRSNCDPLCNCYGLTVVILALSGFYFRVSGYENREIVASTRNYCLAKRLTYLPLLPPGDKLFSIHISCKTYACSFALVVTSLPQNLRSTVICPHEPK